MFVLGKVSDFKLKRDQSVVARIHLVIVLFVVCLFILLLLFIYSMITLAKGTSICDTYEFLQYGKAERDA